MSRLIDMTTAKIIYGNVSEFSCRVTLLRNENEVVEYLMNSRRSFKMLCVPPEI